MKKIIIAMILVLACMTAGAQTSVWHGGRSLWTRGSGYEDDPFLIESADQLAFLSYMVGKGFDTQGLFFKLTVDIDLNANAMQQWIPIGLMNDSYNEDGCERHSEPTMVSSTLLAFRGHFDGDDHSISNIYVDREGGVVGLFGMVGDTGDTLEIVKNVFLTSGYIKGDICGGIVGNCYGNASVKISRCWNGADIEGDRAGGIVGGKADKIRNCYNKGTIIGTNNVGGIVGVSAHELDECYNQGTIIGDGSGGGIVGGFRVDNLTISNCYNTGQIMVSGTNSPNGVLPVGGLVGVASSGNNVMTNCYNAGYISSTIYEPGSLAGMFRGTIQNSFYLNTCGGVGQGTPKSMEEMLDASFVDTLNFNTNVWCVDTLNYNNGFPILGANNLAVNEFASNGLSIYPNPNRGWFTVEGSGELTVFNVLGQAVLTKTVKVQTSLELAPGLYLICLKDGESVSIQRVVVVN